MLISPLELKRVFGVSPNGVLHVGAHFAEEEPLYLELNWDGDSRIYWVEANPDIAGKLSSTINSQRSLVFWGLAWGESGLVKDFYINNYSQASSAYELGDVTNVYKGLDEVSIVRLPTIRLDELLPKASKFDFINLDIQGSELEALKGLGDLLIGVNWIYTEVNRKPLYVDIPLVKDLDSFLLSVGFKRQKTRWQFNAGWGDALYIRSGYEVKGFLKRFYSVVNQYNLLHIMESYVIAVKLQIKKAIRFFKK